MASALSQQLIGHLRAPEVQDRLSKEARTAARLLLRCQKNYRPTSPVTSRDKLFDQKRAYEASAFRAASKPDGKHYNIIGRKIGFTNEKIWTEYGINEPIWGYLTDGSTFSPSRAHVYFRQGAMRLEPRIEPEIIFRLRTKPHSSMSDIEALSCVQWVAHGFEIVQSLFGEWKFAAADAIAANALHRSLHIGKKLLLHDQDLNAVRLQLENLVVELLRNDELVATGAGKDVLGSPIKALLHLCKMLESQDIHPQLVPGEIIATGTLTRAMPIKLFERWDTRIRGINLSVPTLTIGSAMPKANASPNVQDSGED